MTTPAAPGPQEQAWRARARRVIPGGIYGHESIRLLPAAFPQFFSRAEGAHLWDADGRRLLDLMCAYGPNLLGYRHPAVEAAAAAQQALGDTMTGPSPRIVELAEVLVERVAHADWALFCKNGTDATTVAVTVARARTGRRVVLVAQGAYHGSAPWCTPGPAGVPAEARAHLLRFTYNDTASLEAAAAQAGDDLAAVLLAPIKHDAFVDQAAVDPGFARAARALCDARGALLILDEVRTGFRLARGGSWEALGVAPDLSCWGKALGNGHPVSALLGTAACEAAATSVYATGSFWFSAVPMAAALATLQVLDDTDVPARLQALGERLRQGWDAAARRHGWRLKQTGPVQMPQVLFDGDPDFRIGFGWAEAMLARGVYVHPWHNMFLNAAMTEADIDAAVAAADDALAELQRRREALVPHPVVVQRLQAAGVLPR